MTARYYINTNIFGKLIKDKSYFEVFSIETNRYNEFPNLLSIYFTPFSIIEYIGIKVKIQLLYVVVTPKNHTANVSSFSINSFGDIICDPLCGAKEL
ncbi:hypothetical protein DPV73_01560 [Leptospira mayottensis]|nr:hypothetical protein DPV73_01560 [Leptospira mayottensis]